MKLEDSDNDFEEARWRKQLKLHSVVLKFQATGQYCSLSTGVKYCMMYVHFLCRSPIRVDLTKEGADNTVRHCFCGCL